MATKQVTSLRMEKKFKKTPAGEIPVEWEAASLKDVCVKSQEQFDPLKNEKVPYVGLEHIDGTGRLLGIGESSDVKSLKTAFKAGSILFGKLRPYLRKVMKVDFDGVCSTDIIVIIPSQKVSSDFMLYVLQSDAAINFAVGTSGGTKMPRTSWPLFSKFLFPLPPLPEQKKIAEILSSVDEAIEKTDAALGKTKQLKKGLMQKLLTRGLGHKKFKKTEIGEIPAGWDVVSLGKASEIVMGQSPEGDFYNISGDGVPLLNGPAEFGEITPVAFKWTSVVTKLCNMGDILFCVRGNTTGRMNIADRQYCIGRGVAAIRGKKGLSETKYLFFILHKNVNAIYSIASGGGSTFPNITGKLLSEFLIPLPSMPEQHEIVDALSSVDDEISREKALKNTLEQTKKSLMQVLLTGKVRVGI